MLPESIDMSTTPVSTNQQDWTPELVRQHLLVIVESNDRRYQERFISQEKAIQISENTAEKWRESANEWRTAMNDREGKFSQKLENDVQFKSVNERLSALELFRADNSGKGIGFSTSWAIFISAFGLLFTALTVLAIFYK